jgi:hypothetical protein
MPWPEPEVQMFEFTHFVYRGDGTCAMLNLTECETCGSTIQAPNGMTACETPVYLEHIGLKELRVYPPCGYYDEETDMEVCDLCIRTGG